MWHFFLLKIYKIKFAHKKETRPIPILFSFFFLEFQLMVSAPSDSSYHQTKAPIGIWYKRELSLKSFIQLLETLLIKLIKTHNLFHSNLYNPVQKISICNLIYKPWENEQFQGLELATPPPSTRDDGLI